MKEFVEKLIGRLEELRTCSDFGTCNHCQNRWCPMELLEADEVIKIVNQLAEEYGKDTNVTTNNGWITDRFPTKEECKNNIFWITDSDGWDYEADFDLECKRWRDLENGGFIDVIAWHMLQLPVQFQKGSDV